MSNFRDRAKEVKAQGVAERGNFTPSGTPLKIYKFWAERSNKAPKTENFCHFWRVVAIWAPLMFVRLKALQFIDSRVGQVITVALGLAALVTMFVISPNVRIGLAILLGAVLLIAVLIGIGYLIEEYWPRKWNKVLGKIGLVVIGIAAAATVGAILYDLFASFGLVVILWILGIAGLVIGGIYAVGCLADYISGIRAEKRRKREEFFEAMAPKEFYEYMDNKNKTREPGRIAKFFSGVADFVVLVAQVVRVKKWKICPIVTIEDANV